ncbi:MAG: hypothetical protein ACR2OB_12280 [Solirubrobacteraceae bacterium]
MALALNRRAVRGAFRKAAARLCRQDAPAALAAIALTLLAAVLVLRLWRANISQPIDTRGGDGYVIQMWVKGLLDHGGYLTNPDLGAPLGQQLYDFGAFSTMNLHYAAIWLIGRVSSNPFFVLNLWYLLGFALTPLAAFFVLRKLALSRPVAVVCASVFSLLPDHFLRGEAHLTLSQLFVVPLAAYLVLCVLSGRPLFARRQKRTGPALIGYASQRSLTTLLLAIAIGASDLYYASFTIILLGAAGLMRFTVECRVGGLIKAAVLIVTVAGTLGLGLLPNVLYEHEHPRASLFARKPSDSERLGLSLARLVMPIETHRVPALARIAKEYDNTTVASGEGPLDHIGLISSGGLLALLAVALAGCMGVQAGLLADRRLRHAAAATVVMLLVATVGGLSALIAYLVTSQLHAWGRASPFIAFFSLIAIGVLLDGLREHLGLTRRRRIGFLVLLGGVICLAVFDQTSNSFVPDYRGQGAASRSTDRLVQTVQARLPTGAEVFQMPYSGFPEGPSRGLMGMYDSMIPYLHSNRLRWSYGAMLGRPADWAAALNDRPPAQILPGIAAVGFDGVWIDRFGYLNASPSLETAIRHITGAQPLASADRRYVFFDLRADRDRERRLLSPGELAALRRQTLTPAKAPMATGRAVG